MPRTLPSFSASDRNLFVKLSVLLCAHYYICRLRSSSYRLTISRQRFIRVLFSARCKENAISSFMQTTGSRRNVPCKPVYGCLSSYQKTMARHCICSPLRDRRFLHFRRYSLKDITVFLGLSRPSSPTNDHERL